MTDEATHLARQAAALDDAKLCRDIGAMKEPDMDDKIAAARIAAFREAVGICKRVRVEECENDEQAVGALECAIAIMDVVNGAPQPVAALADTEGGK